MEFFSRENIDSKDQKRILDLQNELLRKHLTYLANNSPFYQNLFKENGLDPSRINNIADLRPIPTTTKKDLEKFNSDFLCVDRKQICEFVTTSGTLGNAISIALTRSDIERLSYNEKRSLEISGVSSSDTIQITATLDKRFMAGMAYYLGATDIGAAVIRTGIGNPGFQWENILRFKPTSLIAVPSFLHKLSSFAKNNSIDPSLSSVKKAICIGEPIRNSDFSSNALQDKIQSNWNIDLYSTYASTEMATAFTECSEQQGGHLLPELLIVEILDDKGNEVLPGEIGEVTVTPLGVEGMPLLRFRTGDLSRAHIEECKCGRKTMRLGPVEGRKQQMIKLKGTTIFPQSIENVLQGFESIDTHVVELSDNELGTDKVKIYLGDNIEEKELMEIKNALRDSLRVSPEICLISGEELLNKMFPRGSRKPNKIIDLRKSSSLK